MLILQIKKLRGIGVFKVTQSISVRARIRVSFWYVLPFYQPLLRQVSTPIYPPCGSVIINCSKVPWDTEIGQEPSTSGASFIQEPIPSVLIRLGSSWLEEAELVLIFPFSLVTPLDLTPFPRTLVLRASHIDLWEQPGPADFSAGYKPRSRQRQKRTWLEEKWGFARSVNWEDCFKPSKLQQTAAKHNRGATPRSSDESGRPPPAPTASFLSKLSGSVAKDLGWSTQLWCPGNWLEDGGQMAKFLGVEESPRQGHHEAPGALILGIGFLSLQLGFPGTETDVGNSILSLKKKWLQLKKQALVLILFQKHKKLGLKSCSGTD